MIIYIAGPMTGIEDFNRPAFNAAEQRIKELGHTPVNPAWLPVNISTDAYMRICLPMIDACDAIVMLDGWNESDGATLEWRYATYPFARKRVFYELDKIPDESKKHKVFCPWCGQELELKCYDDADHAWFAYECPRCGATSPEADSKEAARDIVIKLLEDWIAT